MDSLALSKNVPTKLISSQCPLSNIWVKCRMIDSVYIKSDLEKAFADEDNKADKTGFMLKGIVELLHQVNQRTSRLFQDCAVPNMADAYLHTCSRESIHACIHTYRQTDRHTYTQTDRQTHIQTYIQT